MTPQERLQRHANIATIVAGWTTALTLVTALIFFMITSTAEKEAAIAQSDAAAVAMVENHYQLVLQNSDMTPEEKADWIAGHAVFQAETIYNLRKENRAWRGTVAATITENEEFFRKGLFHCEEFDDEFVEFVRAQFTGFEVCGKQ